MPSCRFALITALMLVTAGPAQVAHAPIDVAGTASAASALAHQGRHMVGSHADVTDATVTVLAAGYGGTATHDALASARRCATVALPSPPEPCNPRRILS